MLTHCHHLSYINDNVSSSSSRRGFLGGVAVGGLTHSLIGAPLASSAKRGVERCVPAAPGVPTADIAISPAGRTIWSADAASSTISAHRRRDMARTRSIDVGGAPLALAISPDGRLAAVTTASYDRPGLTIVDLRSGEIARIDVGPEPRAVAFAPDGRSVYVTGGGGEGTLTRVGVEAGRITGTIKVGKHPRGLAVMARGGQALVALNGEAAVALVAPATRRIERKISTKAYPREVAVSPDGSRALVTHSGFGERAVTAIDLGGRHAGRSISVGADPTAVAFSRTGSLALATARGTGTAAVLNGQTGRRLRTVKLGGSPGAVAFAGKTAIVADADSGRLRSIRLGVLR